MFSIFHMSEANLASYVQALDSRYSRYYWGYSGAIGVIADYMLRHGLRLRQPPEFVMNASEELQPFAADAIRDAFQCEVWNRYGQAELVGSITQYGCGHLHYDMDFSILELLTVGEEDGCVLAEVVGTTLHDPVWPLFRYRTGDLVVYDPSDQCDRGVPGQIVRRIHGRTGHYFTLPDGTRVTNISVIAKKCRNVRFMQVVQEKKGEITVRVVPGQSFVSEDEEEIRRQFRKKVGSELGLRIQTVDQLEKTASGKHISILNRLEEPRR